METMLSPPARYAMFGTALRLHLLSEILLAIYRRALRQRDTCATILSAVHGEHGDGPMKSLIAKRSIVVGGHKTSISLEDAFWNELKMIAGEREMNLSELVSWIDQSRQHGN